MGEHVDVNMSANTVEYHFRGYELSLFLRWSLNPFRLPIIHIW